MNWRRLMSRKRFGGAGLPLLDAESTEDRSPFLKDTDRLVYCSAFRRLQNKTQVQVFPGTDYVRTRLTHSLEVSSVGRSLGAAVGAFVLRRHPELKQDTEAGPHLRGSEFGEVVAAACLAHDIGNPPFG
ncbi:MAG TPA: HD domain-containing protein, partial [Alphaproteobacteria bacterium]|nr:HD domain-containing protein [Alphaproteobacteria bacterium]